MATVKATNVTKYTATGSEGSGDNYIPDGYIKSVEKVWIDTYTVNAALPSTTAIHIGKVPKGKKLTNIIVYLPVLSGGKTTGTVNCGTAVVHNNGTTGNLGFLLPMGGTDPTHTSVPLGTSSVCCLGPTGALTEMSADSDIYIQIDANSGAGTTETACTIRSIIKYT